MAREKNFLLGYGERLATEVQVPKRGGLKNPPYEFGPGRDRILKRLDSVVAEISSLSPDACPDDQAVAVVTIHPRYISKSDFPDELLSTVGLRSVGSRAKLVKPESWGIKKHAEEGLTHEIFVAGKRRAFSDWQRALPSWTPNSRGADDLLHVERVGAFRAVDKLKHLPAQEHEAVLEVVVHNAGDPDDMFDAFYEFANKRGASVVADRRRDVQWLSFVPVRATGALALELAHFSFVRLIRGMPMMRPVPVNVVRSFGANAISLPTSPALSTDIRAAVFDGGLPNQGALGLWANAIDSPKVGPPAPAYLAHGVAVTSALLFGPLRSGTNPLPPFCPVDHVRVLDRHSGAGPDLECYDVLDRIVGWLDSNPGKYQFVNISLGPDMPMDDDDVTAWTATLDAKLAGGKILTAIAVGNGGEMDAASGLNRVQPPSDGVNVLSVGACDSEGSTWRKAGYSSVGPGRCPGLVKPDGVAFGGSDSELFGVLDVSATPRLTGVQGTSFASPLVLRSAIAVGAQLGTTVGPLAIRALLVHRAEPGFERMSQVGWGRFETDASRLITCEDNEALVIFQGTLPLGQHLRIPVPLTPTTLTGPMRLSATLVIAPDVDPEHPSAYTRAGLEVSFRPNSKKHTITNGKRSAHAKTTSFFSCAKLFGDSEFTIREDSHKWEPCLRASLQSKSDSLHEPCFDIYYHSRQGATKPINPAPVPYAFVVSVEAPEVADLYDRIAMAYAGVLVPLKPSIRVPVRT